ncbi:MAG TPA: acyltransferase [Planctomycetota bacterium]|nr:acyltransferase [Planctomycetota bacterium]
MRVRQLISDFLLYLANHFVNRVPFYFARNFFYRHLFAIRIGKVTAIHMGQKLLIRGGIVVGHHSVINRDCTLDGRGGLRIGDNVSISPEVMILTAEHEVNSAAFAGVERKVNIEDYVWIGSRAVILPGVTLGKGCVVAAGAIVRKDVPPYTVVAGVPARPIGQRNSNLNYELEYLRWFH